MQRTAAHLAIAALAVGALSGCGADPSPAPAPIATRTAIGTLVSPDGQTTGRVEVEVSHQVDDFGRTAPLARVTFIDLTSPYDHLTVGGSLQPRGDDPCFDTGSRSGGGTIRPAEAPEAPEAPETVLPAEADGYSLYEIVLHLDWTQVDPETESCLQPVVARAPLVWNE